MSRDQLFNKGHHPEGSFLFNAAVANVFDDMISRSVPLYDHQIHLLLTIIHSSTTIHSIIDFGCSTGSLMRALHTNCLNRALRFTGLDKSNDMLEKARKKVAMCPNKGVHSIEFIQCDLEDPISLHTHDLGILMYTLQFIAPNKRLQLLTHIYDALSKKGQLVLFEKILAEDSISQDFYDKAYYQYKLSQGYSDVEIQNKQCALKNVLIPSTIEKHKKMLTAIGFRHIHLFFQWNNFCGLIANK